MQTTTLRPAKNSYRSSQVVIMALVGVYWWYWLKPPLIRLVILVD